MAFREGTSPEVSVIGEIYLDHVFTGFARWPEPGEEIFTEHYVAELGGGAVTTACALAQLGRRVQLIGVVGRAQFRQIAERLQMFGISADMLVRSEDGTGVTVSVSTREDRTFFTYAGANRELGNLLQHDAALVHQAALARHVHLAFPIPFSGINALLHSLREKGATVSLDTGYQEQWLTSASAKAVLQQTDYLLPNEKEAALLAGSADGYLALCQTLGVRSAVLKLGAAGAVMIEDGREYCGKPLPIDVVDTTGAGDVFNAGFLDALLDGEPPALCLDRACACGSLSTTAAGALGALPTRAKLQQLLTGNTSKPYGP